MLLNNKVFTYTLFFFSCLLFSQQPEPSTNQKEPNVISFKGVEKFTEYLEKRMNRFEKDGDSLAYLKTKLALTGKLANIGKYEKAYELAWELYPKVATTDTVQLGLKTDILIKITRLNILFEQKEKANEIFYKHYKPIKALIKQHKDSLYLLRSLDIIRANLEYKLNQNYSKAEAIFLENIKKGTQENSDNVSYYYSKWQLAKLYLYLHKIDQAGVLLFELKDEFSSTSKHINLLIYHQLGDYYYAQKKIESAILHYEKSLQLINKRELHADFKFDILNRLSELYFEKGNSVKAYKYLLESKTLGEELFGTKSVQNKALFEVKNSYTEKIEKQKLLLLQQEKSILNLKIIMFSCGFCLVIVSLLIYFIKKIKRNKQLQLKLKQQQKQEMKEKEAALESKNKELLSSAMQLLERDGMLEDVKKQLKSLSFNEENKPIIQSILRSLKVNRSQKWKEFDAHFTNLNDSFFNSLKEQFPQLTKTDLKICAFINLGFSSKDISQIMGIAVESLNVSRSRLRKKMNLQRETNLVEFLQNFST